MTPQEQKDWEMVQRNLKVLANPRSLKHQVAIKEMLDTFYPISLNLTTNPELDYQDIYDAFVCVLIATFQEAVLQEYYEILGLIETVYEHQYVNMKGYIKNSYLGVSLRTNLEWLESNNDYFHQKKVEILTKK